MTDESLFDRPPAEWSDHELEVGLAQIRERTEFLHNLAVTMADERDRRAKLYREMADAANPFSVLAEGRILRTPSQRSHDRRDRRRGSLDL